MKPSIDITIHAILRSEYSLERRECFRFIRKPSPVPLAVCDSVQVAVWLTLSVKLYKIQKLRRVHGSRLFFFRMDNNS